LPFSTIVGIDLEERSVITKEWFDNKTIPFVKSLQDVITVNKTADKIQLLKTFTILEYFYLLIILLLIFIKLLVVVFMLMVILYLMLEFKHKM
jgi:hypothetical protein